MRSWILSIVVLLLPPFVAVAASDTANDEGTSAVSTSWQSEWQSLCANRQVKDWYMKALDANDLLTTMEEGTVLPMLDFFELGEQTGRFDRLSSPVRKSIERDILLDIDSVLKEEYRETPVRLLSLGCTGFLQDWYVVGQLIQQGRTNIDLTIVDTLIAEMPTERLLTFFKALEAEGICIKVSFFDSLDTCARAQKTPFHAIYAVNYYQLLSFQKDTWRNLPIARKLLAPQAHLFLSYLNEVITIDARGKIHVVETSPEFKLAKEAIVSAQRSNPRSKDCSIRVQLDNYDPFFFTGPLLYAVSDLLQDGYRDIAIFAIASRRPWISESDLSTLFEDLVEGKGSSSLHWKKKYLITDITEDRRDMVILNMKDVDVTNLIDWFNHDIILFKLLVPDNGHWIVCADQLGLWDIDGKGYSKAIYLPKGHEEMAKEIMEKLFAPGGHWL